MADTRINVILGAKDEASKVVTGLRGQFEKFKSDAVAGFGLGAGIQAFSLLQRGVGTVVDIMGDAVGAASALSETQAKVGQVYKTTGAQVLAWGENAAEAMGMSTQKALEAHATFGNFTQALGATEQQSMEMSGSLVQLAADLASFNNMNPEDVLLSLRSGMAGEAEPMRRLGADVSAARVEMELMELGIEAVNGKFTESDKIMGRYRAIMEDTATGQGDFARTSDGLANSQRTLSSNIEDGMAAIGEALLPVVTSMVQLASEVIPAAIETLNNLRRALDPVGAEMEDMTDYILKNAEASGVNAGAVLKMVETLKEKERQDAAAKATQEALNIAIEDFTRYSQMAGVSAEDIAAGVAALKGDAAEAAASLDTMSEAERKANFYLDVFSALSPEAKAAFVVLTSGSQGAGQALTDMGADADAAKEDVVGMETAAAEAAKRLASAIDALASSSFPELRKSGKEALAELRKSLEAQGDPLRYLQKETMALAALRREAAREERWDIVASIDARLEEIKTLKQGYRAMAESHGKAKALLATTQQDFGIDIAVDDRDVVDAIGTTDELLGNLAALGAPTGGRGGADSIGVGDSIGAGGRQQEREQQHRREREALRDLSHAHADVEASAGGAAGATDKKTGADKAQEKAAKEAAKAEEALAREYERVGEAAGKVAEAVSAIGKESFKDMAEQGAAYVAELRASLEAGIDPIRVMQDEVAALKQLRAEAEAAGRYDVMAAIDLRLQELAVMQKQYDMMKTRYSEEHSALDILHGKLDISIKKAKELLETYRAKADVDESVTDEELARIIVRIRKGKGKAAGGPVAAGQTYLVGERGPERLTMGRQSGYITPNHQLGGGGDVYLDGFLVGRILDERLGRQYGTASRVSAYRRSN